MMTMPTTKDGLIADFLGYFHRQPGIDRNHTNHKLIVALAECCTGGAERCMVVCERGSGVTTTLIHWGAWWNRMVESDVKAKRVLAISRDPRRWHREGIQAITWRNGRGVDYSQYSLVLIDAPLSPHEMRSVMTTGDFEKLLNGMRGRVLYVQQTETGEPRKVNRVPEPVDRHLRGVIVSGNAIALFARAGTRAIKVSPDVPEDAEFYTAYFDHSRNAFICVFEHPSFDRICNGAVIPLAEGPEITALPYEDPGVQNGD